MRQIKPSNNEHRWPRRDIKSIECRKRDLVIRIADWSCDRDQPAFDVEVYVGGVYDWGLSKSCTKYEHGTMKAAKTAAIQFAQEQVAALL